MGVMVFRGRGGRLHRQKQNPTIVTHNIRKLLSSSITTLSSLAYSSNTLRPSRRPEAPLQLSCSLFGPPYLRPHPSEKSWGKKTLPTSYGPRKMNGLGQRVKVGFFCFDLAFFFLAWLYHLPDHPIASSGSRGTGCVASRDRRRRRAYIV